MDKYIYIFLTKSFNIFVRLLLIFYGPRCKLLDLSATVLCTEKGWLNWISYYYARIVILRILFRVLELLGESSRPVLSCWESFQKHCFKRGKQVRKTFDKDRLLANDWKNHQRQANAIFGHPWIDKTIFFRWNAAEDQWEEIVGGHAVHCR